MSRDRTPADEQLDAEIAVAEALADKAMAPYAGRLPAAQLARMRAALIDALATHPNAHRLVAQLARRPVVERSGEVGDDGDVAEDERDPKRGRAKGGGGAA
jgi:hypothetical protein